MTRWLVRIAGRVQGVGFRDYVVGVARGFAVAGTVRNLRDGARVEIDVEGDEAAVEAFLQAVAAGVRFPARVDGVEREPAPPRGARGFTR